MRTIIDGEPPTSLSSVDLRPPGRVFSSPPVWRDQIVYFLLPDRFNDTQPRPPFDPSNPQQFKADKRKWMADGNTFRGGKLKGITDKLDYLKNLGVTALWIGPVYKQRCDTETYHGYAIQNFLDVDPRFGNRQDLRDLVDQAHDRGMYVILDIIYNHTGNNWFYAFQPPEDKFRAIPYRFSPPYDFGKWRSKITEEIDKIDDKEDGVWPTEFQNPNYYTRAGQISNWNPQEWENPFDDNTEFRRGDFYDFKDLDHAYNDHEVLSALIRVYEYWIGTFDVDGFRIDTVKHTTICTTRAFCGAIREYAESIGKDNFLLFGEVTGGAKMMLRYLPNTVDGYLDIFKRNLDATLDLGDAERRLANLVLGLGRPKEDYFDQFGGVDELGSHRLTGQYHISLLDEADMVGRPKYRFYALTNARDKDKYLQVAHAVGVQLTTLGIPCIYYGTEQAFNGSPELHDQTVEPLVNGSVQYQDRYIRECMFGGTFGAYETAGCHFFNENHPTYIRIAAISKLRNRKDSIGASLRRGRQYLREIAVNPNDKFQYPQPGEIVAWSRILFNKDVVVVLNSNGLEHHSAWVLVDSRLHPISEKMIFLYKGDWSDAQLKGPPPEQTVNVEYLNGITAFNIDLPPAGMAILS
ncbi:MAG: alpha-amylase family glycosyl hydrolase [Candidatus Bathyarchaeota archaeon]|nr:alpha-amylase family glycosyl hydrolase [Candidatus Bathyarchaeota archaeon]